MMSKLKLEQNNDMARVFMRVGQLVAALIASAFILISPDVGYAGVCTQAESVHQNCVLGRCFHIDTSGRSPYCLMKPL